MITFFTTTKPFLERNLTNQLNAIKSWTIGNQYGCEVLVFQESTGNHVLKDIPNVRIVESVRSNENGVPFVSDMFKRASEMAENEIVCFINADIIVHDDFLASLLKIHELIKNDYLVVGQRIDVQCDFVIDFLSPGWFKNFEAKVKPKSEIHPPLGSDFFCFPKGQYSHHSLPDLLVGRPGWDLYMIYHTRINHGTLIDLSETCMVWHQNHDYNHKTDNVTLRKFEDEVNLEFLPKGQQYKYILSYCNYLYKDGRVRKSYHRSDFNRYYSQEAALYKLSMARRIMLKIEILVQKCLRRFK